MMPEAMTRAEHTRAAVAHGGSLRMLSFLGLSAVVHGLLAVALLREAPPRSVSVPPSSAREQALVWLESPASAPSSPAAVPSSGPPAVAVSAAPRSRAAPVKRAPADPAASRERAAPVPEAKPPMVEPPPVAVSTEAAPGSQRVAEQAEAAVPTSEPAGAGTGTPEGVAGHAAAPGGTGSAGAMVSSGGGAAGSAGPPDLGTYARKLQQAVGRQRRYPASAARFGMEGTARVHLSIHRDGSLAGAPRLARSSGHEVLDAEALRMVEAAAPFVPLPEGHARPSAEFVIPVDFSLRNPG